VLVDMIPGTEFSFLVVKVNELGLKAKSGVFILMGVSRV